MKSSTRATLPVIDAPSARAASPAALGLTRRTLLELALGFVAARALGACRPENAPVLDANSPDLPSLGGAPDTPEGRTIAAFVDTIVPGRHRDPTGMVGGLDAGAAALFFDPRLPAEGFVPLLVLLLDALADERYRQPFAALTPTQREAVVERGLETASELEFAVQFARLAYCASPELGAHLGYPGPNAGYIADPDFTFGVPLARPMTERGNLP